MGGRDGGEGPWIWPIYSRISTPGLRSRVAKRPLWPLAGWVGVVMGVILTLEEGPGGVGGAVGVSEERVRSVARWVGVRDGE